MQVVAGQGLVAPAPGYEAQANNLTQVLAHNLVMQVVARSLKMQVVAHNLTRDAGGGRAGAGRRVARQRLPRPTGGSHGLNPKPQTPNSKPQTPNPKP